MPSRKRKLILIRHAHRDTSARQSDNGLDEKGRAQVERLIEFFEGLSGKIESFSSPLKRCQETIEPLQKALAKAPNTKSSLTTVDWLAEGGNLIEKAQKCIALFKKSEADAVIVCGHGDMLPALVSILGQVQCDLKKGGVVEFRFRDESPEPYQIRITQRP